MELDIRYPTRESVRHVLIILHQRRTKPPFAPVGCVGLAEAYASDELSHRIGSSVVKVRVREIEVLILPALKHLTTHPHEHAELREVRPVHQRPRNVLWRWRRLAHSR